MNVDRRLALCLLLCAAPAFAVSAAQVAVIKMKAGRCNFSAPSIVW